MDDHEVAGHLADTAGRALLRLREEGKAAGMTEWASEEGTDDRSRLGAERTWIIDPLDGTHDYPYLDSVEWAVHVALVEGGRVSAGAVACPAMGRMYGTGVSILSSPHRVDRPPVVVSGRSNTFYASQVARALKGRLTTCGSAGVKASLVVGGEADVYVHASGLYEWDACAPGGVAEAAGMVVRDLDGDEIIYNKPHPVVDGLVICRPELADDVFEALAG
jgi:3'(2'), 5'-bisphosphate nucleotidase